MTDYYYIGGVGGSWDDGKNWFNGTTNQSNDGFPQTGDNAFGYRNEETDPGPVSGGGSASGVSQLDFASGAFDIATYESGIVMGATVTAGQIASFDGDRVDVSVESGSLTAGGMTLTSDDDQFVVSGVGAAMITGSVTDTDALISVEGGQLTVQGSMSISSPQIDEGGLTVTSGTVTLGDLILSDDVLADIDAGTATISTLTASQSTLDVGAAQVTVSGAASFDAGGADVSGGEGGILTLGAVSLSGSANLRVDGLSSGPVGTGTIIAASISADHGLVTDYQGGTLTVTGDLVLSNTSSMQVRAKVSVGGNLKVGETGSGTLTYGAAAAAATVGDDLIVADQSGSQGTVTVADSQSVLAVDGDADIAVGGMGTLTVESGGTVTVTGELKAAIDAGSVATIVLDGTATSMQVDGTVVVGGMGQATLTVRNGAVLDPPDLDIAADPPPDNAMPVIDPVTGFHTNNVQLVNVNGGTLNAGSIDDGDAGYGKITTTADGVIDALDSVTLGDQAGAEGQIIQDGDGAELDTGDLTIGADGMGLLTVGNGNVVTTDGDATLADGNGSLGTMTLGDGTGDAADQAAWSISGGLTVAGSGKATLLTNDAMLSVGGDGFVIGDAMGSNGLVTMNASTLSYGGEIVIGNAGKGELLFQLGSTVDTGDDIDAPGFTVGALMGGSGSLIASGADTVLNATTIEVGAFGKGVLQVTQGATVQASGAVDIATQEEGVVDSATVSGGSYLGVATDLTVGSLGVATLQALSGGAVAALGDVTIGDMKGASAVVTVSGTVTTGDVVTPSSLGFGGTLTVGHDGIGTLLVEDGALVGPLPHQSGTITIGAASDGQGTVTVDGTASLLQAAHIDVGGTDGAAGGTGLLTIGTGGTVSATLLTVWSAGTVTLSGGTLDTDPLTIDGGNISGDGAVTGDVTDGGSITATGGTLTLSGDVSGSGALLIGDGGTLDLAGTDDGVNVQFVAGGGNEVLQLPTPANLDAKIAGFAAGDAIVVGNLTGATYSYNDDGTDTTLRFMDGPANLGSITLIGSYPSATLVFDASSGTVTIPCFARGTAIRTRYGEVAVEHLAVGDMVLTLSGHLRQIRWIGRRHVCCQRHADPRSVWPIRVQAHAFGEGRPWRDVMLSPDHALFVEGALIPVKLLDNGTTIAQIAADEVTYFHVELAMHDVVFAHGLPVETYLDTGNRAAFEDGGRILLHSASRRHAELAWEAGGYAPLVVTGPALEMVRAGLAVRGCLPQGLAQECRP
jgi:T5SS/PEP-CTERM-associated repeat protein